MDRMDQIYRLMLPDITYRDTFEVLSGDYDFTSMEEVEAILELAIGETYTDGYGKWERIS